MTATSGERLPLDACECADQLEDIVGELAPTTPDHLRRGHRQRYWFGGTRRGEDHQRRIVGPAVQCEDLGAYARCPSSSCLVVTFAMADPPVRLARQRRRTGHLPPAELVRRSTAREELRRHDVHARRADGVRHVTLGGSERCRGRRRRLPVLSRRPRPRRTRPQGVADAERSTNGLADV